MLIKWSQLYLTNFGIVVNFSWEHWSELIIWWSVHSRKLVWDLDQSTRRHVKTGYFREGGSCFLEIAAVHVASVQVGHLPVNPGHLSTPTWMKSEENRKSLDIFGVYLLVQSSVGVVVTWGSLRPMKTVAVSVVCKPSINPTLSNDNDFHSPDPAEPSSNISVLECSLGGGIFSGSCCSCLCISVCRESQCRPESPGPVWH